MPPKTGLDNLGGARWGNRGRRLIGGGGSPAQGGRWMFCFGGFGWGGGGEIWVKVGGEWMK